MKTGQKGHENWARAVTFQFSLKVIRTPRAIQTPCASDRYPADGPKKGDTKNLRGDGIGQIGYPKNKAQPKTFAFEGRAEWCYQKVAGVDGKARTNQKAARVDLAARTTQNPRRTIFPLGNKVEPERGDPKTWGPALLGFTKSRLWTFLKNGREELAVGVSRKTEHIQKPFSGLEYAKWRFRW
jgi:hypothetical protein